VGNLHTKLGVTLYIFHNDSGEQFFNKTQLIQWLLSMTMIRVYQIKG
jgi:hypothetical protein